MDIVKLTNLSESGERLEASFCPSIGMNLLSFKKDGIEMVCQKTKPLFTERSAGLGALIGPHFHHRKDEDIHLGFDESVFPHILKAKEKNQKEPFSHGIARYVPWKYSASSTQIEAWLLGTDRYQNTLIKDFEGQDFEMHFHAMLVHDGLLINYSIRSEKPSVIGFHYYYELDPNATVEAFTQNKMRKNSNLENIPSNWYQEESAKLQIPINQELDLGFEPKLHDTHPYHKIQVRSETRIFHIEYTSSNEDETSWQLYHPDKEEFVCIEPLSASNPRSPRLTFSNLQLKLNQIKIK